MGEEGERRSHANRDDTPTRSLPRTRPTAPLHPDPATVVLNRELSWLSFNERVLSLAADRRTPVLERAKFLAIYSQNLDEFFQVRVAGLTEQRAAGVAVATPDGMSPAEQLRCIRVIVADLHAAATRIFHEDIAPELREAGIRFSNWVDLDDADRAWLVREFEQRVFPVLTPLAFDPARPFPYISSMSLNLAVLVRQPGEVQAQFARVKIPPVLPRFVVLPDGQRFVPLEQVIAAHLDQLFRGLDVVEHHAFRVTRNADIAVEEDEADDLLQAMESELTQRRFGHVVRLEVQTTISEGVRSLLVEQLGITDETVMMTDGPLDLGGLWSIHQLDRPDLKEAPLHAAIPPRLEVGDEEPAHLFTTVRQQDVLIHHPYESFAASVQRFVEAAARDDDVLAIKTTLYRTSGPSSPIVSALLEAAEAGKQVVTLVEVKARFDEEANIEWARALEDAGVHVTYGVLGLKTHSKVTLVVRQEAGRLHRYAHVGTGNYNERTARVYEDVGLLTADPDIGVDLTDLFNVLTGYSRHRRFRKLVVAPNSLRDRLLELIDAEADAADDGRIVLKVNALVDEEITHALYRASQAGTSIDLVVRGICCLRPGVPDLSENVRVRSIVGRHLEHSRIYRFGTPARGLEYLIGSADLMTRNLDRRVEVLVPVSSAEARTRLDEILEALLNDTALAWQMCPDGSWQKIDDSGPAVHTTLRELAHARAAGRVPAGPRPPRPRRSGERPA